MIPFCPGFVGGAFGVRSGPRAAWAQAPQEQGPGAAAGPRRSRPGPFLVLGAAAGAMNPNSGSHPDPVANSVAERVTPGGARPVSEGDLSGLLPGSKA